MLDPKKNKEVGLKKIVQRCYLHSTECLSMYTIVK
jgi:hypothetical protein